MRPESLKLLKGQRVERTRFKFLNEISMRVPSFFAAGQPLTSIALALAGV
jgi:hypothetical protein